MRLPSLPQRAVLSTLVAALALAATACGQKGALYLPDRGGDVVTRPTQTPAEPAPSESGPATRPDTAPAPADEPTPTTGTAKPASVPPR